jgi:hypothetical protein
MSQPRLSRGVIPGAVLVLVAMLLIAVLYTINPVNRQTVGQRHAFLPTGTEWSEHR